MKFKKNNLSHWCYLFISLLIYVLLLPIAYLARRPKKKIIILYGHKFNGNLWAFYEYKLKNESDLATYYLSMDKAYVNKLRKEGLPVLWTGSLKDVFIVALSSVIITDHHPQVNKLLIFNSKIKFVDVWHGRGFKVYPPNHFYFLNNYCQIWTVSKHIANLYVNRHSFPREKIKVTGYGKVDALINNIFTKEKILIKYQIESYKKIILIAPTWIKNEKQKNILPFGVEEEKFINLLNEFGKKSQSLFILRAHLNVEKIIGKSASNIKVMSYADYPIAEEFLYVADILISDWSSIAFDYLILNRPTIFLDVEAPSIKNRTFNSQYRFGYKVKTMCELINALELLLNSPQIYEKKYKDIISNTREIIYGGTDDGKSLDRYMINLRGIL